MKNSRISTLFPDVCRGLGGAGGLISALFVLVSNRFKKQLSHEHTA
jgi:hypothetical protein